MVAVRQGQVGRRLVLGYLNYWHPYNYNESPTRRPTGRSEKQAPSTWFMGSPLCVGAAVLYLILKRVLFCSGVNVY